MRLLSRYGLSAALIVGGATVSHAQGGRGGGPETTIKPGEECPAGMTEIRPLRCMAPQISPPSILDYRPRSTLVTAEHRLHARSFPPSTSMAIRRLC
jgi:hypothetical protein